MSFSAPERSALQALDLEGLLAFLRELIAIPSLGGQESPAQRLVADWLEREGLTSDCWRIDVDELSRHPQWSHEIDRTEALGVVGWYGDATPRETGAVAGQDLLLNGHVDVVPPGDLADWLTPPFSPTVKDGRVYGRGAADMKGGLCCALFALKAIRDAGVRLRGRLSVASVVGEEDGGTGTLATMLRGHLGDGAIIVEPTALRIVYAQAGALTFRLLVTGRAAHGGVREEGVSAIERFLPLFSALRELEAERCAAAPGAGMSPGPFAGYRLPWPIEVGTLRAGDWPSSVPGELVAEGRYGVALGEDIAGARRDFELAIARAASADAWLSTHPPRVEWWGGRFEPASTAVDDPIVTTVSEAAAQVSGFPSALEGVTYGSDMRLLANVAGIPTVMFGPGDVRVAHMADEYVPLAQMTVAARTLVVAALRYCGVDE